MGDITTHAEVADFVMQTMKEAAKKNPKLHFDNDLIFFEMGNWLTDVSGLLDPVAFISAKETVWDQGVGNKWREDAFVSAGTNLESYFNDLFGTPIPSASRNY